MGVVPGARWALLWSISCSVLLVRPSRVLALTRSHRALQFIVPGTIGFQHFSGQSFHVLEESSNGQRARNVRTCETCERTNFDLFYCISFSSSTGKQELELARAEWST